MSSIEWTDITWNPTVGCSVISPGCTNCYAMRMASRLEAMGVEKYAGLTRKSGGRAKWTGKVRVDRGSLKAPFNWRGSKRVFVNSMSDLFHEDLGFDEIRSVWEVMEALPQHNFQVLTKRESRLVNVTKRLPILPNVWIGVSVENRFELARLDHLRSANAAVRFVSFEPLLEDLGAVDLSSIDWCIVGGESGPSARPMEKAWVDNLFQSSRDYGVAFHFKQWGGKQKKKAGRVLYGRTFDELPNV